MINEYNKVLALVTNPNACSKIIESAKKTADSLGAELLIVSIQSSIRNDWDKKAGDLEILNNTANENDAELTVIYSDNNLEAAFKCICDEEPTHMFCGMPGVIGHSDFIDALCSMANGAEVYSVDYLGNFVKIN